EFMNALVFMAEAESGGQNERVAQRFGVDWPHLIAQMICFCIVCFFLYRFAYKPVLQIFEDRRQLIAQGLANGGKIKVELARTEAQRQDLMAQANVQATKFIDDARAAADRLLKQETQKATAAAEEIVVKARHAADQDHARMLAELKQEVGRLVVQT